MFLCSGLFTEIHPESVTFYSGSVEVSGSIPLSSTKYPLKINDKKACFRAGFFCFCSLSLNVITFLDRFLLCDNVSNIRGLVCLFACMRMYAQMPCLHSKSLGVTLVF